MRKLQHIVLFIILAMTITACDSDKSTDSSFVTVRDGLFYLNGEIYHFAGTNYWQGMHLGSMKYGDRDQLKRELDQLKEYGITNLRVMASCEADPDSRYCMQPPLMTAPGEYDDNLWEGLDFLLDEMGKRDMKAVMVLSNYWTWSGGFAQYLKWADEGEIPYPQDEGGSWYEYIHYAKRFLENENTLKWYSDHVKAVVSRVNSINGIAYANDPTIMSWQLANEPRGCDLKTEFYSWIENTSALIKSMAPNQLVSLGSEGNTPSEDAGLNVTVDNAFENIDYITMHIWVQNWNWYTPGEGEEAWSKMIQTVDAYWNDHVAASVALNKPLVLEEYGLARDEVSYAADAAVSERDRYYRYMYSRFMDNILNDGAVQGVNFWAYSGEGRSPRPGQYWEKGDPFVGDPPHELQGWYGVYDTDISTLEIIREEIMKLQ